MKPIKTTALALLTLGVLATMALAQDNLSMWSRTGSEAFMPKLIEAFNASHEMQIDLQIVPSAELIQKYATAAAGGSAPDFLSLDLIFTAAFADAGQLVDLTDIVKGLPYYAHLSPAHLEMGSRNERIYGTPMSADASVLLWNKGIYRQAGLDPEKGPANWVEFEDQAAKVTALGDDIHGFYFSGACGGCNAFTFMPLVWANDGEFFLDGGTRASLNIPQMHDAVSLYRDMWAKGYVPASAQTDNGSNFFGGFATGKIGISILGSFAIGALATNNPDLDYGVTFIPGKDGGWSSFAGGDNFVATASRDNDAGIKEFLEFVYSVEGQTILAKGGSLPTRNDIAAEALQGLDSRYLIATEAMAGGHKTPSSPVYNDLLNSGTGPWVQAVSEAIFGEEENIENALIEGEESMQRIMDMAAN